MKPPKPNKHICQYTEDHYQLFHDWVKHNQVHSLLAEEPTQMSLAEFWEQY